jgi:putative addiction module killer protein
LAGIKEGKTIHLVEGEKDVDRLIQGGLIATTTTDTLKWCPEYTAILEKADVVILFDYDKAGFERRDLLCLELQGRVGRLRVVELPGLGYQGSHGQDVSDWLARGHTTRELVDIVEKTPDYKLPQPKKCLRAVSLSEFFSMELPKRELLLTPFLPSQGLCLLYAKRGVGNFGDCKSLGDEIAELRIHYGPGIRIYYSKIGHKVILFLCGGDKGSQSRDIDKAKEYLKEYQLREKKHGKK